MKRGGNLLTKEDQDVKPQNENKFGSKIPIVVTGLSFAGKSSYIQRLRTDTFKEHQKTTMGVDIEFLRYQAITYHLFDLGGHLPFRKTFWENYVELAEGLIFIFDSVDRTRLEEANHWFWQVVEWGKKAKVIVFLANKWDVGTHLDLETISESFELKKFADLPEKSFHISPISCKTGYNVNECFEWLTKQLNAQKHAFLTPKDLQSIGLTVHPSLLEYSPKDAVFFLMEWDETYGPVIQIQYPSQTTYVVDVLGTQLWHGTVAIYGHEKLDSAQDLLLTVKNVNAEAYVLFDSIPDETVRGGKKQFMLALVAPKINYFESLKLQGFFLELANQFKSHSALESQAVWEGCINILSTSFLTQT